MEPEQATAISIEYNPLSNASYFIVPRFNDVELASASAFFVHKSSRTYLITNWHVVSGRDPHSNTCLSATAAVPNNLLVRLHKDSDVIEFENIEIPLLDQDGAALWIEHPVHGRNVDVVAVPVAVPQGLLALDITTFIEPGNENTKESVTDDVYILGFPFGLKIAGPFPIWKRATIASEPEVNVNDVPMMLVDTASRSGVSGSPVMLHRRRPITLVQPHPKDTDQKQFLRHYMKLVGVYSGRIGADETSAKAQLGIVWKASALNEILSACVARYEPETIA